MDKRFLLVVTLSLIMPYFARAAVNERARHVNVISTQWCDIIFTPECSAAAALIAREGDEIFERVKDAMQLKKRFRLPVVISCDSEVMSAEYMPVPYNRIVIYCTQNIDSIDGRDTGLLSLFAREATRAVAQCQRGALEQVISSMFSDVVQPSYLVNMPLSYFEGLCNTVGEDVQKGLVTEDGGDGAYDSGIENISYREGLSLLARAKVQGHFPTWINAAGARDIYPDNALARAAGTAFAAYIQQRWGMEKYFQMWKEAGKFHFFRLNAGIFHKVYGVRLKSAWRDFEASVPVPQNQEQLEGGSVISKYTGEDVPCCVASAAGSTVYYSSSRGEVLYFHNIEVQSKKHRKKGKNKWKRLFFYTGVSSLSLSPDGTLLAMSHKTQGVRESLVHLETNVYDISTQKQLGARHKMHNAVFLGNNIPLVAGICTEGERTLLVVESLFGVETYRKQFRLYDVPRFVERVDKDNVAVLLSRGKKQTVLVINTSNGHEEEYGVPGNIVIANMQGVSGKDGEVVFSYLLRNEVSDSRVGIMRFKKASGGEHIDAAQMTMEEGSIAGGVGECALFDGVLTYVRHYSEYAVLVKCPLDNIRMGETFEMDEAEADVTVEDDGVASGGETILGLERKRYNPFKYIMNGTWIPMLPLYSFSLENGYLLSPGLGATYITSQDALGCAEGVLSFGTAFADPSTSYTEFINDYSLSAYTKLSVLPVDIALGSTWRWNDNGRYTVQTLAAVQWMIPLEDISEKWTFDARALWTCRTDKVDEDGKVQSTPSWIGVADAFNTIDFSIGSSYSDYRRAGISDFEQLGFEVGSKAIFSYDMEDVFERPVRWSEPTRLRMVGEIGLKAPRLLPLPYVHHFVFSLPLAVSTAVDIDLTGTDGAVLDSYAEILLLGYEAQWGMPGINLYLARCGMSIGYENRQVYDIVLDKSRNIWSNLDFYDNSFNEITANDRHYDYVYIAGRAVLSPVIGMLTRLKVTIGSKMRMRIKDSKTDASLILNVIM